MKKNMLMVGLLGIALVVSAGDLSAQQNRRGNAGVAKPNWKANIEAKKAERQQKWKEKALQNNGNSAAGREEARQRWQEKMAQRKQMSAEDREAKKAEWKARWGEKNADKMQQMKEKWAQMREQNPQFKALQDKIAALKEAKGRGIQGAYQERMQELRQYYQTMDPQTRANLSRQMPDLAKKLDELHQNPKMWETSYSTTGSKGGQHNYQGQVQKQGNDWTQQGAWTNAQGKEVNVQGQHTRDGNQAQTNKTWIGENGNQVNMQRQSEIQGNTVNSTANWTNAQGKTAVVNTTAVKDGNSVQSDVTVTGPNGQTHNITGSTEYEKGHSNTQWTNDQGQSFETSSDWVFDLLEE